jgi:hypothetical protein
VSGAAGRAAGPTRRPELVSLLTGTVAARDGGNDFSHQVPAAIPAQATATETRADVAIRPQKGDPDVLWTPMFDTHEIPFGPSCLFVVFGGTEHDKLAAVKKPNGCGKKFG